MKKSAANILSNVYRPITLLMVCSPTTIMASILQMNQP